MSRSVVAAARLLGRSRRSALASSLSSFHSGAGVAADGSGPCGSCSQSKVLNAVDPTQGKLGHRLLSPADQAFKYDAVSFFIDLVLGLVFQIVAMCINPKPPQTCNMNGRLVAELVASEAIIYLCYVPAPAFGKGLV
jgi:hypothetical protein